MLIVFIYADVSTAIPSRDPATNPSLKTEQIFEIFEILV